MSEKQNYDEAVKTIKTAILQSQYDAARTVNEKQLMLYYGIGKYISLNSRNGFWGKGAINAISEQLDKELPGLRGFTSRNLRYMRTFYEEWKMLDPSEGVEKIAEDLSGNLELANSKTEETVIHSIWNLQVPNCRDFPIDAFFCIGFTHHRVILGKIKNLEERLFYIKRCADEHFTVEALKNSLAADDYHHLKRGKFKTSYLGQLQGYLSVLDGFERKPHENPAIGIILCKDMNKSFVDYVIQDYTKPMGVATYKTSKDMSEELRRALPDTEDLKKLLDEYEE